MAGEGRRIGLYGFGAAAHIIAQVARWLSRDILAFTRSGDHAGQGFARKLGACWAGASDEMPTEELDCAIIYALVGAWVPAAVRKGGRVVCAGIHMSDIPSFPYSLLWQERQVLSVANLTRNDGVEFFDLVPKVGIVAETVRYPLAHTSEALSDLRAGWLQGAAVLAP
jgi:propanol-preferring alcohol dehydrogenase